MGEFPHLEVFRAGEKGFGVKTTKDIEINQFVIEYVGVVIHERNLIDRLKTEYAKFVHHYAMKLEQNFVIDAYRRGNLSRFVNHSCDPNLDVQKWFVNGTTRIAFYTKRAVHKGEELTIDYKFERYSQIEHQICYCGSSNCQGVISN